jgi:hypothetical protein
MAASIRTIDGIGKQAIEVFESSGFYYIHQIIGLQRLQKPIRRLGRLNERDLRPCGLPQSQAFSAW